MWAPQSRAFLYLSWVFWLIDQISFKRKNHLDRSPGQLHQCQNSDRLGPGKYVTLFSQLTSPIWFRISSISGSTDLCQHSSAWTTLQPWEIQIISDVRLVRPAPFPSPGHREPSQCLEGQPFTYNLVFTFCCKQFYAEAQTIVCLEHNGGGDQPEQPLSCQVVRLPRRIGMGSRGQASRPSSRPGFSIQRMVAMTTMRMTMTMAIRFQQCRSGHQHVWGQAAHGEQRQLWRKYWEAEDGCDFDVGGGKIVLMRIRPENGIRYQMVSTKTDWYAVIAEKKNTRYIQSWWEMIFYKGLFPTSKSCKELVRLQTCEAD